MSEEPPITDSLQPSLPDYNLRSDEKGYVQDPAKAEEMAYAEKPHREDALALNELKQRALNVLGEMQKTRDEDSEGFSGTKSQVSALMDIDRQREQFGSLDKAESHSLRLAEQAAKQAEKDYDENNGLVPAIFDEVPAIRQIMQEASNFKASQGDDLWGSAPFTDEELSRMVESGHLFVYKTDGEIVASVLLPDNDERMWGDEQGGDKSAIYVHKLCVGNDFRGNGAGQKVIELAEKHAQENGKTKLRLDCPYDNRPLCEYYEGLGFREVRRYDRPLSAGRRNPDKDVYRAALYQKNI